MDFNEIWVSNDNENIHLRILKPNLDGSITVAFDFNHFMPKRTFNYQKWYIEKYYSKTEDKYNWSIDPRLKSLVAENA